MIKTTYKFFIFNRLVLKYTINFSRLIICYVYMNVGIKQFYTASSTAQATCQIIIIEMYYNVPRGVYPE